jgi:hypothetical protein
LRRFQVNAERRKDAIRPVEESSLMAACRLEAVSGTATCHEQGTQRPGAYVRRDWTMGRRRDRLSAERRDARRSGHSTRMLRVMPQTGRRAAGLWRCPRLCGGGREPRGDKQSRQTTLQVWRAVCAETCKHGFGGGRLETCRKVTRWPSTLLTGRKAVGIRTISGKKYVLIDVSQNTLRISLI